MKTSTKNSIPGRSLAARLLPCLALVAASLRAVSAAADAPAEPKTHTLFMGADILVEQGKQVCRVEDVVGGSFVIKVDGREVKVPANWGAVKMKVNRSLKLTGTAVTVEHLKAERAYTPGNDPTKKFMRQQGEMLAAQDAMASSASNYASAQIETNAAKHNAVGGPAGQTAGMPPLRNAAASERSFNAAGAASQTAFGRDTGFVGTMQDELAQELYDAIDVDFDISAEKPVSRPYVVVLAQFHARDSKPGESQNWLYAKELDPLDNKPQKVRIREGGMPPGYALESYQVHVYDRGQELATSVADKQVALTRREAFAYLMLDYVGSHKGATLPAAPALGKLSPEARARLSADQLKQVYYVKVSKEGLPVAAYVDSAFASPVDETVSALVSDVRFYPALENGKPVDGVAELKLTRIAL